MPTAADSPFSLHRTDWKAVLLRTWKEAGEDNVGLVAAGVAFYGFLALVPLVTAVVLIYGLVVEPAQVREDLMQLFSIMPGDIAKVIATPMVDSVQASDRSKGWGLVIALGVALFGARNGAGAIVTALNIAYEENETRGFVRLNLLALAVTGAAAVLAIVAAGAIAALGHLDALLPQLGGIGLVFGKASTYIVLGLLGAGMAATLYRFAPDRQAARWQWLTPGSIFSALGWLVLTLGFGLYVANFGNYDATYGSLGAVVVLLTWLYLSSYVLLLGAELNAELEHQTASDTTTGAPVPLGRRGAWVADHVADSTMAGPPAPQPARRPAAARANKPARWAAPVVVAGLLLGQRNGTARYAGRAIALAALIARFNRPRRPAAAGPLPSARPQSGTP
ncbi:YihY/virulence factor BrkB family protein [Sphingomonas jatrophae]|nr:YihY/virulence factor BrkB family protein [Sphingomonas jatrophae]